MIEEHVTIVNKLGLHARAASEFVKVAQRYSSAIAVQKDDVEANGKSIISMMMLQASLGVGITLVCEGDDEKEAMKALVTTVENRFGEEE